MPFLNQLTLLAYTIARDNEYKYILLTALEIHLLSLKQSLLHSVPGILGEHENSIFPNFYTL